MTDEKQIVLECPKCKRTKTMLLSEYNEGVRMGITHLCPLCQQEGYGYRPFVFMNVTEININTPYLVWGSLGDLS